MSLCDGCPQPGNCCKQLRLFTPEGALTVWKGGALAAMARHNLPFQPLELISETVVTTPGDPDFGRTYQEWFWSCPKLGADGRCTIYSRRPDLCRSYKPATDFLCVFHSYGSPVDVAEAAA
jgi:Fe-S-cluster containining protein